jgi:hypothetical protein
MISYRIRNIDIPLVSFNLAKEILDKRLTPRMGGYVGTSMRNVGYHDFKRDGGSRGTYTIWGHDRVDRIDKNGKTIWKRHFWTHGR